jgi:hypothetical protein
MPQVPNRTKRELIRGSINLNSDDIRVALYDTSASFSFDPDVHEFVGDVLDGGTTAQEPGDASYSRQQLANESATQDNSADEAVFDADDVTFPNLDTTNDIQGVLVFKQVTSDSDSPIIQVIDDADDSDLPVTTNGTDFVIEFSTDGIVRLEEV